MPSPVVLTMRPWCSAIFPVEELMAQRDDLLAGQRAPLEREAEMRPHQRKYLTRELVSGGFGLILGVAGMYLAYLAIIYSSPYPPTDDVAAVARLIWDLIIAAVTLFVICGVGGIVILAEAALQYFAYRRPLA
jgi:hypothetical protein